MMVQRGDVVLAFVDFVGAPGGKLRPPLVVQADYYNSRLSETVVAAVTSNLVNINSPAQLLIDVSTTDGAATGLLHNSAVRCERLHSIPQADVRRIIGKFPAALMLKVDDCLKEALGIP